MIVIREISDLLRVPAAQLEGCLSELGRLARDAKRMRLPPSALREIVWSTDLPEQVRASQRIASMPVDALGLREITVAALRERKIECLRDFANHTEAELTTIPGFGPASLRRIDLLLRESGLDWHEAGRAPAAHRDAPVGASTHDTDATLASLALSPVILRKLRRLGIATLDELLRLPIHRLVAHFTRPKSIELVAALDRRDLLSGDAQVRLLLWTQGLLQHDRLALPTAPDTPTIDLRPWLGPIALALRAHGIETLGELAAASPARLGAIRGLGARGLEEIDRFLAQVDTR